MPDDRAYLCQALQARGVRAVCKRWDDPAVDWRSVRVCLLRSLWECVRALPRPRTRQHRRRA